jgi:hypothetical protein
VRRRELKALLFGIQHEAMAAKSVDDMTLQELRDHAKDLERRNVELKSKQDADAIELKRLRYVWLLQNRCSIQHQRYLNHIG